MPRTITFLNASGDQTISWTPDRDGAMREYVERLMAAGYTFFVLRPGKAGEEPEQVRLRAFEKAVEAGRQIILANREADELIHGIVDFVDPPADLEERLADDPEIARDAQDVVGADAATAVRPVRGG